MRGKLLQRELRARAGFPSPSRITLRVTYADVFQLIHTVQDERGSITRYIYDFDTAPGPSAVGKLERVDLPDVTLPDGSMQPASILLEIDARGRLAALTSAEGHVQRYTFGPAGGSDAGLPIETLRDAGGLNVTEILG